MKRVMLIAYEGRIKGEKEPFDVVKEEKPLAVVIGAGDLLPAIEEAIASMKAGEEKVLELPPEKAFGERNPDLVVIIPEREFKKRGIKPYPGLPIEADGRTGRVLAVSAGRVQVDFNHPLAGKTVEYKVKLIKELKDMKEAAAGLFTRFFGYEPESVEFKDGVLKVSYIFSKDAEKVEPSYVAYILTQFDDVKEVRMEKIYRKRTEEAKAPAAESSDQ